MPSVSWAGPVIEKAISMSGAARLITQTRLRRGRSAGGAGLQHTSTCCDVGHATQSGRFCALGFSLTEGIIQHPAELQSIKVVQRSKGVEVRMTIPESRFEAMQAKAAI
jgi:hypothetical protein